MVVEPDATSDRHAEAGLRGHGHRGAPDLVGLRHLAHLLADRFVAGYVLSTGQQTLPYGNKLRAVPIDALWRLAP